MSLDQRDRRITAFPAPGDVCSSPAPEETADVGDLMFGLAALVTAFECEELAFDLGNLLVRAVLEID